MNQMNYQYPNLFPRQQNSITWVQGIEGAKAFSLTAKESVVLMDSETDDTFYIKYCDDIGRCTLRVFKYKEELSTVPTPTDMSEYVKKSELEGLINKMLGGGESESTVSTARTK